MEDVQQQQQQQEAPLTLADVNAGMMSQFEEHSLQQTTFEIVPTHAHSEQQLQTLDNDIQQHMAMVTHMGSSALTIDSLSKLVAFQKLAEIQGGYKMQHDTPLSEVDYEDNLRDILNSEKFRGKLDSLPSSCYNRVTVSLIRAGHPAALRQMALIMLGKYKDLDCDVKIQVRHIINDQEFKTETCQLTPSKVDQTTGYVAELFNKANEDPEEMKSCLHTQFIALINRFGLQTFQHMSANASLFEIVKSGRVMLEIYGRWKNCFITGFKPEPQKLTPEDEKYYHNVMVTIMNKEMTKDATEFGLVSFDKVTDDKVLKSAFFFVHMMMSFTGESMPAPHEVKRDSTSLTAPHEAKRDSTSLTA